MRTPGTESAGWRGSLQGAGFCILGQDDIDLHHIIVFLSAELDIDGILIDFDVFRDDLEQFVLHGRDVVCPSGIGCAFVRDEDRQPVFGNGSRFLSFAEEKTTKK